MRKLGLMAIVASLASVPVLADSVTVYVGYADNLRPSGFFPNPWLTASGVVSQTPDGQSLDTGAIRVDNNDATPITIGGMTVTMRPGGSPVVFNFWSPLVIPAGGRGLFLQTGSYNFDTSDFGIFGAAPVNVDATHPLGGCTNPANAAQTALCTANAPTVAFTVNGGPLRTFTDSGHILDTFGYDLINLPPPGGDGNESINWNLIGTAGTREGGGGSVPEPASMALLASALAGIGLVLRRKPI